MKIMNQPAKSIWIVFIGIRLFRSDVNRAGRHTEKSITMHLLIVVGMCFVSKITDDPICGWNKFQILLHHHHHQVKMLRDRRASMWLRNAKGDLPLHEAASSGRRELVQWLLDQRPKQVNTPSNDGRTILHIAAGNDYTDMCKVSIIIKIIVAHVVATQICAKTIDRECVPFIYWFMNSSC